MRRKAKVIAQAGLVEQQIRNVQTIGELERLAGIGSSLPSRSVFWLNYARLGASGLDAGCEALRQRARTRRLRETAAATPGS